MNKIKFVKEYTNGDIMILRQSGNCIHSGMCVKNLSKVFKHK
ncbi:MAG TPA: hypothetical protein DCY06_05970 [Bacteroidetes bacterium]|nr:hypothetical protein [Bacteroidota bacterium]HRJ98290.1 (4Fe-4S)-binding protein [Ignavibacteria bacterium]